MAYNITWDPRKAEECKKQAELAANRSARQPDLFERLGYLYRFNEQQYSYIIPYACPVTGDGEWGTKIELELEAFAVKKWHNGLGGPSGATLWVMSGSRYKYVNFSWNKKFACKTVEEALESYIARRTKQARIYRARAEFADKCVSVAKGESRF